MVDHGGSSFVHPPQVFLGDQSVGKTSIITRFMYDKFDNTYQVWAAYRIALDSIAQQAVLSSCS